MSGFEGRNIRISLGHLSAPQICLLLFSTLIPGVECNSEATPAQRLKLQGENSETPLAHCNFKFLNVTNEVKAKTGFSNYIKGTD